jgi:hypothetical protein
MALVTTGLTQEFSIREPMLSLCRRLAFLWRALN